MKKTVRQKCTVRFCGIVYFLVYIEQEFMVQLGNTLSMTFTCSNGIRQGGQLSQLLYIVYTDIIYIQIMYVQI